MSNPNESFEYKVSALVISSATDAEKKLNNLAEEGWELVAVALYGSNHICYFKRKKKNA